MTDDTKTHYISRDLAKWRETMRECPVCNNGARIVKRWRVNSNEETGNITFGGEYWVCEDHDTDTDHYQYSPGGGKRGVKPRETVGAHVPKRFRPDFVELPRGPGHVIKRAKDGTRTIIK